MENKKFERDIEYLGFISKPNGIYYELYGEEWYVGFTRFESICNYNMVIFINFENDKCIIIEKTTENVLFRGFIKNINKLNLVIDMIHDPENDLLTQFKEDGQMDIDNMEFVVCDLNII